MQRKSRRVRPIVKEPLDPHFLFIDLVFFVVWTAGEDVVHLKHTK